ncbi:asparaginase [Janibacter melonis]|uniref:Asparaginase n=1 Tax=Janibacter melonis TaxID=262209 RepID=A0A650GEZ0_9MICO|nr:asparaginase [Janibacter melonis]QGX08544.1 asparaginase [Janibacter melonis]
MSTTTPDTTALDEAPVLVHVTRGGLVESAHHGRVAAVDAGGRTRLAVGDTAAAVYPRSTLKPIQALAMVEHGLDLAPHHLATVCSSHSAQERHLTAVTEILASVGLEISALQNTPALPIGELEHAQWLAAGRAPEPIAQDCSGKHAGMLVTCVVNGWSTHDYLDPEHPLQQAVMEVVTREIGPITTTSVDGCGAPLPAVPLDGLAAAFGRLAGAEEGTAARRVADAMRAHPEHVGGDGREVTDLMARTPGLVAKDGAEAVFAAGTADGLGLAVKISDGAPFARARTAVLAAALLRLGVDSPATREHSTSPTLGHGRRVGEVRVVGL